MTRVMVAALVVAMAGLAGAGASVPLHGQAGLPREAEIHDLVRRYVEAREKRDRTAIAALFTADADQLVSSGEWRRGRDNVVAGTLASSAANAGTRSIVLETVRLIGPDLAIADGRYEISGVAGAETRRMWSTFVAVREDGTWRIAAIRNMLPAPAAPPSPSR